LAIKSSLADKGIDAMELGMISGKDAIINNECFGSIEELAHIYNTAIETQLS